MPHTREFAHSYPRGTENAGILFQVPKSPLHQGAVVCFGYGCSIDFRTGKMKQKYYEMLVEKHTDKFDDNF